MMLIHKPQPALSSPHSMSLSHRRQSSAPGVVVQPTRIPGLLSLSKPLRSSPPRNQQRHTTKNVPKQALSTSAHVPTVVRAPAPARTLTPAVQIYTAPATSSPKSRGRAQESHSKEKDKNLGNKRSASRSSGKDNGRQPSPPIPSTMTTSHNLNSSQAEVPVNFANHLDPFLDHSTFTPSPPPRKQTQTQTKEIATSLTHPIPTLARSVPLPISSNRQSRHQQQRLIFKKALTTQEFPICDDMSEIADDGHPSTPIARRLYQDAPLHSAPISTREFFSSSVPLSSPSPQKKKIGDVPRARKHRRTPSEGGVFHMSSDEEVSSGPSGVVFNTDFKPNMKALIGPFNMPATKDTEMNTTTPVRVVGGSRAGVVEGSTMNMSTSVEKAAFFASSVFQNSPSPDELPDPLSL